MHHDSSHDSPALLTPAMEPMPSATTPAAKVPDLMPAMPEDPARAALRSALSDVNWSGRPEIGAGHRAVALALRTCGASMAERFITVKYGHDLWRRLWSEALLFGPATFDADELVDWALAMRFAGCTDPARSVTQVVRHAAAVRMLLSAREAEDLARQVTGKLEAVIC